MSVSTYDLLHCNQCLHRNRDKLQIATHNCRNKYMVIYPHTGTGVARHERESKEDTGTETKVDSKLQHMYSFCNTTVVSHHLANLHASAHHHCS